MMAIESSGAGPRGPIYGVAFERSEFSEPSDSEEKALGEPCLSSEVSDTPSETMHNISTKQEVGDPKVHTTYIMYMESVIHGSSTLSL
jgi:hypothetical protein